MDREPIRTVTGKSSIPAGTAGTGTATALSVNNAALQINGGAIADFNIFLEKGYRNIWIYVAGEHKVAKVKSVMRVSNTQYIVYCDRVLPFVFNNSFTVVIGCLIEWGAENIGAAAGEVDGAVLPTGSADNRQAIYVPGNGYPIERDVVTVNGTGTSIKIYEVS